MPSPDTKSKSVLFPRWMIRSKVHPTTRHAEALNRPRLLELMERSLEGQLTLVHAPAGYGKSTLLSSWCSELRLKSTAVAWLSVDEEDNEALQLLTYLVLSLSEANIDMLDENAKQENFLMDLSPRNLISFITHAIAEHDAKVVLVIDDFERLQTEAIDAAIRPLIKYAPQNLHLVIATRTDAFLPIADMEAKGNAQRLEAPELALTAKELASIYPQNTTPQTISRIHGLTEGWPVAAQMIKNAVSTSQSLDSVLAHVSGNRGILSAYLSEQVFNSFDDELQKFLLEVSLRDRVDCGFVDCIRQTNDSHQLFSKASKNCALILPHDHINTNYRLHPLFREYLYTRLSSENPGRMSVLHDRAAKWFDDCGDMVNAVKHAVKGEKPERAEIYVLSAGGLVLWLREGLSRLRAALDLIDTEIVTSSPRLALIQCVLDVKDGRVFQARQLLDRTVATAKSKQNNIDAGEAEKLDYELMLLGTMTALYEGKQIAEHTYTELIKKIETLDIQDHVTLAHHYTLLCLALTQRGMFEAARTYAETAIPHFRCINSLYGETYIYFHLGDISFAQGRTTEANKFYQKSVGMVRKHFNDDKSMKLIGNVLLAELKYETNQISGLASLLSAVPRQLEEREAWFDIYAAGYVTASNLEFTQYGIDAALKLLDNAEEYSQEQKLHRLSDLLTFQRIELLCRADRLALAESEFERSSIQLDKYHQSQANDFAWRERDAAAHSIARLRIRQNRHKEALVILNHFVEHAREFGHTRSCVKYSILQCLAAHGLQDNSAAFEFLDTALDYSLTSGFIRSFIDEGPEIERLIRLRLSNESLYRHRDFASSILKEFGVVPVEEDTPLLSAREYQVMEQLARGHSNKIIARNIDISENTVRFHLKNIYSKLRVDNRLQAVNVAAELSII